MTITLKELAKAKKTTMYRIAKDSKLGQSTINEIFNGKRKKIQLSTATKIAKALGVDVETVNKCIGGDAIAD
jgi:transcriptional regulator with XRE-family HTH domain